MIALFSQTPESSSATAEQQLENLTASNGDTETDDDAYLQQLQYFLKSPVNLNTANEEQLKELKILTPIQIKDFIVYRNLLGRFISLYELQAIPGWDVATIEKLRPYVTAGNGIVLSATIRTRLSKGEHSLLVRMSQTLEKAKGYLIDSATATNFYPGSPQKLLFRYGYQYKNLLQYGLVGEKDAGEQFFKGKQKQGFDFYSAHFFVKDLGNIKSVALGDFTVNLGQGLTQWQSLAFKKSGEVVNIKRESAILKPYNSAGEINFHRGAGITVSKRKWSGTAFLSFRKIDGNLNKDTSQSGVDFVSSLQTSGYHRTQSESDDKGVEQQAAFGGNLSYQNNTFHVGINGIQYHFKLPLIKTNDPYNLYALTGKSFGNYSIDYSFTYKNMHWFGELATTNSWQKAFVGGVLISAASDADICFLYRNISKAYQGLYNNAFTESTYPNNEKGLYSGVSIHPGGVWRIEAYADFYQFPWLKFATDAPSGGKEYFLKLMFRPNKRFELYSHFSSNEKGANLNPYQAILNPVQRIKKQNWRTQFIYHVGTQLELSSRAEIVFYNNGSAAPEQGFLWYAGATYKPIGQPWALNGRWQFFQAESYSSRSYAYENDVLYSYSIPVFYNSGIRYYLNASYQFNKKSIFWLRYAQTRYKNGTPVGSGLDAISGSVKTEIRLQGVYRF